MTFERSLIGCMIALTIASGTAAEVPRVATDIAPVHGLVSRVMEGVGVPDILVQPGSSPHDYSMRPSEARSLDRADAVFWIGSDLEPWLGKAINTLAADARVVALLEAPDILTQEFREGAVFDHDHDHTDHTPDAAHADHDHNRIDPHAWLDPENGKIWLDLIAEELAALDPDNAGTYRTNATRGREEIDEVIADISEMLASAGRIEFLVFHDAYHYFENRFGIPASGSISLSDASDPSPARIEAVRDQGHAQGIDCVLAEPQFNQSLVETVTEDIGAQVVVIDPIGRDLEMGPGFYPALIRSIAADIIDCTS